MNKNPMLLSFYSGTNINEIFKALFLEKKNYDALPSKKKMLTQIEVTAYESPNDIDLSNKDEFSKAIEFCDGDNIFTEIITDFNEEKITINEIVILRNLGN